MREKQLEPLGMLFEKYGCDLKDIERFVSGDKYSAVMLKDKKIGICANVDCAINRNLSEYENLDLENIDHRIFLNAYYNAKFNNYGDDIGKDLLKIIDMNSYEKIVMIGNFHPIVSKFKNMNIVAHVFDLKENSDYLTPMSKQKHYLQEADCVILTATTIFNKTFMDILDTTKDACEIFLIGPSLIMKEEILNYRNIKYLFGTTFSNDDNNLLDLIANNVGPRHFLRYGKKTMLLGKK